MTRLQRHILEQVFQAVFLAVGLFVFVLTAGILFRDIFPLLANGMIGWGQFLELIALVILGALPYALPIGLLAGILIVLGRMSAQNEILAMKSIGMSLWRITAPIYLIALGGVALSLYINFELAPNANTDYKRILGGNARANPSRFIVPGEFVRTKKHTVYAASRTGDLLGNVWVWQLGEAGQIIRIVRAETAEAVFTNTDNATGGVLQLTAHNTMVEDFNRKNADDFSATVPSYKAGRLPITIPLDEVMSAAGNPKRKLRYHTFSELMELRKTGWNLHPDATTEERFASRISVQCQIQSNFASALGILSMTLLAIPLGIKTSRSETLVNIAIALALALTFYVFLVMMTWITDPTLRPDLLIWLPNLLYQSIGAILLWKAART